MTSLPFSDLHSFKDFVVFVRMCAPDNFPRREGVPDVDQWTLDLAFRALREGIELAIAEKGHRPEFSESLALIEEAHQHYKTGNKRDGFFALDRVRKTLGRVRT